MARALARRFRGRVQGGFVAPRGLATKFSFAIALVVVVSVGAMSLLAVSMSRQSLRDQVSIANRMAANLTARAIEQYLADAANIMREASGRPKLAQEIRTGNWAEAATVLGNFLRHFPQFDYVFVQDPPGVIRVRVPDAPTVGQDFSHRDFFQEVMRTRTLYVSDVYVSQAAQRGVVSIAVPVTDSETVKGVLVGALSLRIEVPVAATSRVDPAIPITDIPTPIGPKIGLVVDDEPEEILEEILWQDGHRVDAAANGAIALDRLEQRHYDLVICDTKIPVLDGVAFFQEAERRLGTLRGRIIFLTGDTWPRANWRSSKKMDCRC
jgi:hypothetical protein